MKKIKASKRLKEACKILAKDDKALTEIANAYLKSSSNEIPLIDKIEYLEEVGCPQCKGKLLHKSKLIKTEEGSFVEIFFKCVNTKQKLRKFWKKPSCNYNSKIVKKID